MRPYAATLVLLALPLFAQAADPPRVEKFLHAGTFAQGDQDLTAALAANPRDDQARFGLGVLRFVRGVERLGQSLYEYGLKGEHPDMPFLRLPVPKNPDPAPITYRIFRRIRDDFHRDLSAAEVTLAGVTDDRVKLPLRLAAIRFDLDGDGQATDRFFDLVKKLMGQTSFTFEKDNPEFLVNFDRGDVAWFRAYCHLLMAMLDGWQAFDTSKVFAVTAGELFAKPRPASPPVNKERWRQLSEATEVVTLQEPARLGHFRQHLIQVAVLNRETWRHIRAETDNDHEWLPHPKQTGVLGLPVRNDMIDAWLGMMAELEELLEGRRTFLAALGLKKNEKGFNLKVFLDEPPLQFRPDDFPGKLADKYFFDGKDIDIAVVIRAFQLFQNSGSVGYAAWFN